jgi:hypothetical protein
MPLKRKGGGPLKEGHPHTLRADAWKGSRQDWAHHAFSGGGIDLIQAGMHCDPGKPIYQYDITSAYPAGAYPVPSLRDGTFFWHDGRKLTLDEFKAFVEPMNMLSMFEVKWNFSNLEYIANQGMSDSERMRCGELAAIEAGARPSNDDGLPNPGARYLEWSKRRDQIMHRLCKEAAPKPPRFYPFFYRCNGVHSADFPGTILRPSRGWGRYYRAEILAAIEWIKAHYKACCERSAADGAPLQFEFCGAWEFVPATKEQPFNLIEDLFNQRSAIVAETKRTGVYNVMEKVIKLVLNSIFGKMAQSIGNIGTVPKATNPFYAGAITAGTRARSSLSRRCIISRGLFFTQQTAFNLSDRLKDWKPLQTRNSANGSTRSN